MGRTVKAVSTDQNIVPAMDPPALTIEGRENQLIALAQNEAERRIRDGTASSAIICHFLQLGTVKAQAELEHVRAQTALSKAKMKATEDYGEMKKLLEDARTAFTIYQGNTFTPEEYICENPNVY